MARPPIHDNPKKVTLYLDEDIKDALFAAAKAQSISASALVSQLVLALPARHREGRASK